MVRCASAAFGLLFLSVSSINMLRIVRILGDLDLKAKWMKAPEATQFSADKSHGNISSDFPVESPKDNHKANTFSYQNNHTTLCTRDEIVKGSWVSVQKLHPPYIPKNRHLRCYSDKLYEEGPWNTFQWEPHSTCELSKWNWTDYCSIMSFGTVLIAGDSLSWEQYSSLGQLLGLRIHQKSQWESKQNQENHIQFACHRKTRLVFRRDDLLTNLESAISETFPQVIVINRGAHYQNDTSLVAGIQENIKGIKEWKEKCTRFGVKCHLFWRTSVPGHPLCDQINFTKPINDLEGMEAWIGNRSNYDEYSIKYHWYDYQHQNNLALATLRQGLGENSFEVLDAYHLNVLRPDEHRVHQRDCLHNCYPGKMDVYNQLLLHYLRAQRTKEDVDYLTQLFAEAHRAAQVTSNETQPTAQLLRR